MMGLFFDGFECAQYCSRMRTLFRFKYAFYQTQKFNCYTPTLAVVLYSTVLSNWIGLVWPNIRLLSPDSYYPMDNFF